MNKDNNHINSWSDADIRKYLNGELSARQMHDLEQAALDDPFLADALEGFDGAPAVESDMDELKARLATRLQKEPKTAPIAWFKKRSFRVAAAIILLLGAGMTFYYTSNQGKPNYVSDAGLPAINKKATEPPAAERPASPAASSADSSRQAAPPVTDSTALVARSQTESGTGLTGKNEDREDAMRTRRFVARKKAVADKQAVAAGKPQTLETDSLDFSVTKAAPPVAAKDTIEYKADLEKSMAKSYLSAATRPQPLFFSGRVVDINNHPLVGASLFLNSVPKIGTTTDAAGNFNFKIVPRDTLQRMTVTLAGYEQADFSLNTNVLTNNIIQLHQETKPSLDEVVITGYGAKRKETYAAAPLTDNSERLDSAWLKVYPVVGKLAYEQYLDTAKRSLKVDTAIHGMEKISFQVDQKGQITAFKIEQSLSPAHDAGLIQLISSGPAWKLLHGKKARAMVRLDFP